MVSYSRFVFASGFAFLVMAAIGLETLALTSIPWRRWFWAPTLLFGLFVFSSLHQLTVFPEPIATHLATAVMTGKPQFLASSMEDVRLIQNWFTDFARSSLLLSSLGLAGWWLLYRQKLRRRWAAPLITGHWSITM